MQGRADTHQRKLQATPATLKSVSNPESLDSRAQKKARNAFETLGSAFVRTASPLL